MVATMAALITREELGPDPDILSKFSAVAVARTACIEDNRARENARENIRKKLAMEAGREKQDSCDLQVKHLEDLALHRTFSDLLYERDCKRRRVGE